MVGERSSEPNSLNFSQRCRTSIGLGTSRHVTKYVEGVILLPFFSCLWQPSIVVSQQALNTFLSRPLDKRTNGSIDQTDQTECSSNSQTRLNCVKSNGNETSVLKPASFMEGDISVEEILCSHGRLDPGKAADMKRIDHVRPNHQGAFSC